MFMPNIGHRDVNNQFYLSFRDEEVSRKVHIKWEELRNWLMHIISVCYLFECHYIVLKSVIKFKVFLY